MSRFDIEIDRSVQLGARQSARCRLMEGFVTRRPSGPAPYQSVSPSSVAFCADRLPNETQGHRSTAA